MKQAFFHLLQISYGRWFILILSVAVCLDGCSGQYGQATSPEDYYYNGNQKINIDFVKDTIGIVLKPGQAFVSVKASLKNQGYDSVRSLNDQIILVVNSASLVQDHAAFVKSIRNLKEQNQSYIQRAGYFVKQKNSKTLMMVTDELIIQFNNGKSQGFIDSFFNKNNLVVIRQFPGVQTQYLVSDTAYDALKKSQQLLPDSSIYFAYPNFVVAKDTRLIINDPLYNTQWHLQNTDNINGTADADIDAELAWDYSTGDASTIIAIIDNGFDVHHSDLAPNLAINRVETSGSNNFDDDGNGYPDDKLSWNFSGNSNALDVKVHGTAASGMAAAKGNNGIGVSGSCPDCSTLPIEFGLDFFSDALAFEYATKRGAKIISCSWSFIGTSLPVNVVNAINAAHDAGVTIFFAMSDNNENLCNGPSFDYSSLSSVIAISGSTNTDQFDKLGYGNCMDLLSPYFSGGGLGKLKITTTDISGREGYNDGDNDFCGPSEVSMDYTTCEGGTSMATPLTAGVAGLLLSLDHTLSPQQIQWLLQDCADKIEPGLASYSDKNGFSMPSSGSSTHGYGRLNAYEAVKIAAPVSNGSNKSGLGGVDIFVRDNHLDWGNTEQPSSTLFEATRTTIPWWESMDIKVDAPPFQTAPANNNEFESLINENPKEGMLNKVYVRVRNRGYKTARDVSVKLHWVHASLGLPSLPVDFWQNFPNDATDVSVWHPVGIQHIGDLPYCGSSVVGVSSDAAKIASFDFTAPVPIAGEPNHYCLMALISSPDDPMATNEIKTNPNRLNMDFVTTHYNNATHKNYIIEPADETTTMQEIMYMQNPDNNSSITTYIIVINKQNIPINFGNLDITKPTTLKPGQKKKIFINITSGKMNLPAEITIQQMMKSHTSKKDKIMGGITINLVKQKK